MKKHLLPIFRNDAGKRRCDRLLVALALAATLPHAAPAQSTSVTASSTVTTREVVAAGASRAYEIADDVTLTFAVPGVGAAAGGALNVAAGGTLTIGPSAASGTVIFKGNAVSGGNGGAISNAGYASIANALFTSNTTTAATRQGGAIASTGTLVLSKVRFENNYASTAGASVGGAIYLDGGLAVSKLSVIDGEFINNVTTSQAGAIYIMSGSAYLENVSIKGNANATAGVAGALMIRDANGSATFVNVAFEDNHVLASGGGIAGAMRNAGALDMTGGKFTGNYSGNTGYAGALHVSSAVADGTRLTGVLFEGNRAGTYGGGLALTSAPAGGIELNNVIFKDNWAGTFGGAVEAHAAGSNINFNLTASGGTTSYAHTGNFAGLNATPSQAEMTSGTAAFAANAAGGGFYYAANSGTARFNIADGVSLTIGSAANVNHDSLASADAAAGRAARLIKDGGGLLVLNADNSYWRGSFDVTSGTVLLGNADAKLGGKVTIAGGATFGGSGTLMTNSAAAGLTVLDAQAGSTLQIGAAGGAAPESLTVAGTLALAAGATLDYDLFGSTGADLLVADYINVLGTGTIRLGALASGTYTLARWTGGTGDVAAWAANVVTDVQAGRNFTGAVTVQGGTTLQLTTSFDNVALTWTGVTGTLWNHEQENWSDAGGVTKFINRDTVTFDQTGANRTIEVAAGGVSAAAMNVSGSTDYNFIGGGIAVTGTLIKTGTGRLTLNNTGVNSFGKISLREGELAISSTGQLGGALTNVLDYGNTQATTFGGVGPARIIINGGIVFDGGGRLLAGGSTKRDAGFLVASGGMLTIKNFTAPAGATGHSGFFYVGAATGLIMGPETAGGSGKILFENNSAATANVDAAQGGGVMLVAGTAALTNATFLGNHAVHGGALTTGNAAAVLALNDAVFTSNTAAQKGGALNNALGVVNLAVTRSGTTAYEGNTAATAADGGFLYQAASGIANIDIAAGSTLVIGGDDAAKDTIGGAAGAVLNKSGSGALVLRADSSAYAGITTVNAGSLILRGVSAQLGGSIIARSGAVLGGSGTFGNVTLEAGSSLDIGEDATNRTLSTGTLAANGATLNFTILGGGTSDRLNVAALDAGSAGNIINLDQFFSGTYDLGQNIAGLKSSTLTLRGADISSGARQSGSLSDNGASLQLELTADASRALTWQGVASGTWAASGSNWSTGDGGFSGLFADGDRVAFGDAAAPRDITIGSGGVTVAEMVVDTTGSHAFHGGGILADVSYSNGTGFLAGGTSSKLIKNSTGTLVFKNGANTFRGGIDLNAGTIEFTDGAQLDVGAGAAITVSGSATLRPLASATLSSDLALAAGATAIIDVTNAGHSFTYNGASSAADAAATLVKTGAGSLTLSGSAALGHGATRIDGGFVFLRDIASPTGLAHAFDFNGGWLDLSDTTGPADGSTANDWAGLVFTGSLGGVIGANDKITLGAGDAAFGIGSAGDASKQGVFVVIDAGAGNTARMTGGNFYVGNTRVLSGTLEVSDDSQLGLQSAHREVILDGGALSLASAFNSTRALEVGGSNGAVNVAGFASATWAGNISGEGKLIKTGGGELVLSGSNRHASTEIADGTLAAGASGALGSGVLRATGPAARLRTAADDLVIANAIELGANALVIDTDGRASTFSGAINGSGPLTIANAGAATLTGANTLGRVIVSQGARLIATGNYSAFGGTGVDVEVNNATLEIATINTVARSVTVNGGVLLFTNADTLNANSAMLRASGSVTFAGSATIALGGVALASGKQYKLIDAGALPGIETAAFDAGAQNAGVDIVPLAANGELIIAGLNQAVNPGKDIAAAFDAMSAATGAVYSRLSENFLLPVLDRRPGDSANNFWLRGIGSFADFDGDADKIGHRDDTYGAMVGYDHVFGRLLVGLYAGYASTKIKTDNRAETDAGQPHGGVYAAWRMGPVYLAGDFMMGTFDADTIRNEGGGQAKGSYKAGTLGGSLELGMALGTWEGGSVKPAVAVHYMRFKYKDQAETGPGAVEIADFTADRRDGFASVQFTQAFTAPWNRPAMVDFFVGKRFSFGDKETSVTGAFVDGGGYFDATADRYETDGFLVGLGARFALGKHALFSVAYDYEMGTDYGRHSIDAVLRLNW